MSRPARKFVAVLMLLWLPLFSAAALAASVTMQLPDGHRHEAAAAQTVADADMDGHCQHHGETPAAPDEHGPGCTACGVCHLACTGYLAVPCLEPAVLQTTGNISGSVLVSFRSVTFTPLLPPPLARA